MVGWHHQFNGHELGQTPGDSESLGSLACSSLWGLQRVGLQRVGLNNSKTVKGGSREGHRPWADVSVTSLVALEFLSFGERAGLMIPPRIGLHPASAPLKQCDLGQVTCTLHPSAFPSQSSRVNFQRRGPSLLPLPFFMEY